MAIEGDIESAYDNVDKEILLNQLRRKIKDEKFISFMRKRLKYDYVDGNKRYMPLLGIPQGGIDSPYLFNIYLEDLDIFVNKELTKYLDKLNEKMGVPENRPALRSKPRMNLMYKFNNLRKAYNKEVKEAFSSLPQRVAFSTASPERN